MPITAAFVVEDGTGLDTANAYDSVADVSQYHADAGNTYWATLSNSAMQTCIVRATKYIDKRFAPRFRGTRRRRTQGLSWPRLGAYDNDGFYIDAIPVVIARALAEYAIRAAIYMTLAPDPARPVPAQDMTTGQSSTAPLITGQVRNQIKKVGPIETEYQFITNAEIMERWKNGGLSKAPQSAIVNDFFIPEYPEADLWIEQVLRSPFGGARMTRGD